MARASRSACHSGWPSNPISTFSNPTREAIATPFHWLSPMCAIS